ncbi:MAG: MFS transporter, partial [Chloroflexota bacterium]
MAEQAAAHRMVIQVVATTAVALFVIFGIRLSFSVFFAEFLQVEGWSSAQGSSIFSVSMIVFALTAPPTGYLLDRFGPATVFSSGALILGLGLFLSSYAQSIQHIILTYGVIAGAGLGIIGLGPMAGNISSWVQPEQRGRAIGAAFAGTGFGSLVFVPMSERLIFAFGWRTTFAIYAAVCVFFLAPVLFFLLKKSPHTAVGHIK